MNRLRLYDILNSRLPSVLGFCATDVSRVALVVNAAQERLLHAREAGDHGWWGSWAHLVFAVDPTDPYITAPRDVARLSALNVCASPVPLHNEFFEYLQFADGNFPKSGCSADTTCFMQVFERGTVPLWQDLTVPGYGLRFYAGDSADYGRRILVTGSDANAQPLYSVDTLPTPSTNVRGLYVTLAAPYADVAVSGIPQELSVVGGIQKDVTTGPVSVYEVNLATGAQSLVLVMEPGETVAAYRRYYLSGLPTNCCGSTTATTVQVDCMAKLDLIPCRVDSDYLLIQSVEAILAEAQSMRFADMDGTAPKAESAERHRSAIRLLQGQLVHYLGKTNPAVWFAPFGSAHLSHLGIGRRY